MGCLPMDSVAWRVVACRVVSCRVGGVGVGVGVKRRGICMCAYVDAILLYRE